MVYIVLLGDSIFDNGAYVPGRPDVLAHAKRMLGGAGQVQLLARDGAITSDVFAQLHKVPKDSTHLVVSVGGNDALRSLELSVVPTRSIGEALQELGAVRERFRLDYASMLDAALVRSKLIAVCTIYYPRFPDPNLQELAVAGLSFFNDVILLEASRRGIPIIDLRQICQMESDFANAIEPSDEGGAKIADAVLELVAGHNFGRRVSIIWHPLHA